MNTPGAGFSLLSPGAGASKRILLTQGEIYQTLCRSSKIKLKSIKRSTTVKIHERSPKSVYEKVDSPTQINRSLSSKH
uniref:Uncharacterized protein n=1 Tax=Romanomermis culicivorax TaxID=13658 RepID=A0A915HJC4_ROMCU